MEHPVHVLADVVTSNGYEMQFETLTPSKVVLRSIGSRKGDPLDRRCAHLDACASAER